MTMCNHVHNTVIQCTKCTGRCTMQIRNPEVCDMRVKVAYMYISNKPPLVVEQAFPLMGFVDLSTVAAVG